MRKALGSGGRRFSGDQFTIRIRDENTVIVSRTTSGSGGTVTNGDSGLVQVTSGLAYSFDEIAAGTASLANYNANLACTNSAGGSPTVLPTTVGGTVNPRLGDVIVCTITNTRSTTAELVVEKSSIVISDPANGTVNPKLIPGAIVEYAITVRNVGAGRPDSGGITIVDLMPANVAFDTTSPVTFVNGLPSSGLSSFNAASMVGFSSAASGNGPFTYTPVGPFDPMPSLSTCTVISMPRLSASWMSGRARRGTFLPTFSTDFSRKSKVDWR